MKPDAESEVRNLYPSLRLPPGASSGLGIYVYALRDPRCGQVFYVGKGRGNRVFNHVLAVLTGRKAPDWDRDPQKVKRSKAETIRSIHADNVAVEHLILRDGIKNDPEALMVEQAVIDAYAATGHPLANLVSG
jgi:hypothetical protein